MTQQDINAMRAWAGFLSDTAMNLMLDAFKEQDKLDSLVHFCQTGKFLDELDHK